MFQPLLRLFKAPRKPRAIVIRMHGKHYHLKEIYDRVNRRYFEGKVDLPITWFAPKKTRYRHRVILGSFHRQHQLIKINQILDQEDVPVYFIEFIVYHEILHYLYPPILERRRRRKIHHQEFKQRERAFHDYALVQEFRKVNKSRWFIE